MPIARRTVATIAAAALALAACGDDATSTGSDGGEERPTVVVTTSILGDVVGNLVGDQADVVMVMPPGADPHDFQASARQVNQIREADALIVNGGGFEEGLVDVIESAEADGVATFEALSAVATIELGESGRDDDHGDEDDHDGDDPHFFTDPERMAEAAAGIAELLVGVEGVDADALTAAADAYVDEVRALDTDVEAILADIPEDRRVLVTNHEVFGYFADRYGFEVVGTVIPTGSTSDGASAGALAELAEIIAEEGVPAIFADTSSTDGLAQTLADEVGDIEVVALFSESLGAEGSDGDTYIDMVRTNAERIAEALA